MSYKTNKYDIDCIDFNNFNNIASTDQFHITSFNVFTYRIQIFNDPK